MVNVLGFSLWGDNETYIYGAIINAELAKLFYPGFECWIYVHKESVPDEIINELEKMENVKVILKTGDLTNELCKPRMWRFEPIDDPDVEVMMSRDLDTRILPREKMAVDEWLRSNKKFHIMRDHPHHYFKVLAGMFGTRKIPEIPSWKEEIERFIPTSNRLYDQDFLRDIIYPHIKDDAVVHATFNKIEPQSQDFPIKYDKDYRFVGEYVYSDETRSQSHIDILIDELKLK
jgi:hypothetical protein